MDDVRLDAELVSEEVERVNNPAEINTLDPGLREYIDAVELISDEGAYVKDP